MAGDSGDVLCNHVICCGYTITKTAKNCCEWTAQDWSTDDEPIARHFRAALSSTEAVDEFIYCFQQGVQRAQENQLYETMPEIVPISLGQTSSDGTTEL
ncbi:hypothetical protein NP493_920g00027 [Ridgeia piscesae]|uniref:Uncharacterized protein n=1 Tax=Ridgeia piscesae TaxID=27915 RepID=A0AAD9KKL6_RIDPI|nr:hypothetical protein NP493_920g00027 [Ridgeia piscesae]